MSLVSGEAAWKVLRPGVLWTILLATDPQTPASVLGGKAANWGPTLGVGEHHGAPWGFYGKRPMSVLFLLPILLI